MAVAGHVHWNALNTVDGVHYVTLQSLTETFTTHPHPAKSWAELELGDSIELRVHGGDPIQLRLPLRTLHEHWLAHGGPGKRPVTRKRLAERIIEGALPD